MRIQTFFDNRTWTLSYVVWDETTLDAVIIDPVLDFDPASGKIWKESVEKVISYVETNQLKVHGVFETHAHADHLTAAQILKTRLNAPVIIGKDITKVQKVFGPVFNRGPEFKTDGSQFDRLLSDGESFDAGSIHMEAIHTPGHTPACMSFKIGNIVFTGDALFMPDYGVGRCDFPAGDAGALYDSVHNKLYALPDETRVFVGHDYQPGGRDVAWETTIGESKKKNVHLKESTGKVDFVAFRTQRDATLSAPKLLLPSVQVNMDAGQIPQPEANGRSYLMIPVKVAAS